MNQTKISNNNEANNDADGSDGDRSQSDDDNVGKRKIVRRKSIYEQIEVSSDELNDGVRRKSTIQKNPNKSLVKEAIHLKKPVESSQESESDANQGDSSDNNYTPNSPVHQKIRRNSISSTNKKTAKLDEENTTTKPVLKKQSSKLPKAVRKNVSSYEQSAFDLIPGLLLILFWSQIFIIIFYHYNIFVIPQILYILYIIYFLLFIIIYSCYTSYLLIIPIGTLLIMVVFGRNSIE